MWSPLFSIPRETSDLIESDGKDLDRIFWKKLEDQQDQSPEAADTDHTDGK